MSSKKRISDSEDEESSDENDVSSQDSELEVSETEVKSVYPEACQKDKNLMQNPELNSLRLMCNALCDFSGEEEGDLSFSKGEALTIVGIRKDGWWEAENDSGIRGLVPSTFLKVPDHVKCFIDDFLHAESFEKKEAWDHLKASYNQSRNLDAALHGFGAFPLGFRSSMLAQFVVKEKRFSTGAFMLPKLAESGLSFEDLHWEAMSATIKPENTMLEKVIELVAIRQVTQPPSGYDVTSRHIRMCLHDGNKVLSNICTTMAKWDAKTPKIWTFSSKISGDSSVAEEGKIFVRSNKSFATLGILFELCLTYKKENADVGEMSCGWAFMRLLNDSGLPVKSRTKILKVHDSIPFASNLDASPANRGSLKQFIVRSKLPRMVVSISNLKRSFTQSVCYLPTTLIGPVSLIPLLAMFRKVISNDLLERASFDSAEKIVSPFFANYPRMIDEPDLTDVLRKLWTDKLKTLKRSENCKRTAFKYVFMETVFLLLNCCSLPPYSIGKVESQKARKTEIERVLQLISNLQSDNCMALSCDLEYSPICINQLSASIL